LAGIVLSLYQRKIFPFLWVVFVTFLGGVMTVGTPSSSHFIPVIPALCWLVAIPIKNILETKWPYVAYLLLAGILLTDLNFYFVIYTSNPSYDFRLTFPTLAP
ncbi:MAG: hypothetical protein JNK32_10355, partial [Anaerolineales bacterium]|nr:hypothetical protein [Anaerolineales bacterium]